MDNDTTTMSATVFEADPWWRIDFGTQRLVQGVTVTYQADSMGLGMRFWVGNGSTYNGVSNSLCYTQAAQSSTASFQCTAYARYLFAETVTAMGGYSTPTVRLKEIYIDGYLLPMPVACTQCSAGTYSSAVATSACSLCGTGTYSPSVGATSATACQTCAAGSYCPNATVQLVCPLGSACGAGSTSATVCGVGAYANATGLSVCNSCPNFTTTQQIGSTTILQCRCLAGRTCTYLKRINMVVTLNMTMAQYTANSAAILSGLAQATGAPLNQIVVSNVARVANRRRLLLSSHKKHELHLVLFGVDHLHHVKNLTSAVRAWTWHEAHRIQVT